MVWTYTKPLKAPSYLYNNFSFSYFKLDFECVKSKVGQPLANFPDIPLLAR